VTVISTITVEHQNCRSSGCKLALNEQIEEVNICKVSRHCDVPPSLHASVGLRNQCAQHGCCLSLSVA
jgi:hypothetical protein